MFFAGSVSDRDRWEGKRNEKARICFGFVSRMVGVMGKQRENAVMICCFVFVVLCVDIEVDRLGGKDYRA